MTKLWAGRPKKCSSIPGSSKRLYLPPKYPDRNCDQPSLLHLAALKGLCE